MDFCPRQFSATGWNAEELTQAGRRHFVVEYDEFALGNDIHDADAHIWECLPGCLNQLHVAGFGPRNVRDGHVVLHVGRGEYLVVCDHVAPPKDLLREAAPYCPVSLLINGHICTPCSISWCGRAGSKSAALDSDQVGDFSKYRFMGSQYSRLQWVLTI